jgi:hypothetical protein
VTRRGAWLLGLALAFGPVTAPLALAQPAEIPKLPPPPEHPAIEPAAVAMLKALSQRLAAAKSMSFTAVTTYESPARNGQPLYYSTRSDVTMQRPDKLRVITPGDGPASDFYYDGHQMIAYAPRENLVAVSDAPATVEAAIRAAYEKAAIFFPFAEVLAPDPAEKLIAGLTGAFVVGESAIVGDTITDIVAVTTDRVQAEIWIGAKDGLPRMIRATYPTDPEVQRYEIRFSDWHLNPKVAPADFTSPRALKAPRMPFQRPDMNPAEKQP